MVEVSTKDATEKAKAVKAGELPGPAKSLAEAMCRVMEHVSYVQKDKQMSGGGSYRYVSVEAVIDALRPEMIRQQLVLLPAGIEPLNVEHFEGKNGGRQNRTQVIYTFKLVHAASGQSEPVVVIGEAIDVGDKSSNKAMTAARKYALLMAFNIETGLDPDDTPSHTQERAAAPQPKPAEAPKQPIRYAEKDNLQLRARFTQQYAQANSRDAIITVGAEVMKEAKASKLSAADCTALRESATESLKRFPATA
jgi:hypothetical protein